MSRELSQRIKASEAQADAFIQRLLRLLDRRFSEVLAGLGSGDVASTEAAAMLGSLFEQMRASGLDAEMASIQKLYGEEIAYIRQEFQAKGNPQVFAATDREVLQQLITYDAEKYMSRISQSVADFKSGLMRSVLTGEKPVTRKDLIGEITTRVEAQLKTEINTSLQAFSRTVTANKAAELGYETMEYDGPDDGITRDFCADLLAKDPPIYTIEEIQAMDNEQGLPVLQFGGGYNCRHRWIPVK